MLFGVFVIVWPMRKVLLDKPITGWIIALAIYCIGIIGKRSLPNVFCIWFACQYIPFFYIGMRLRAKAEKKEKLITEVVPWPYWIAADLLLFVGTMAIGHLDGIVWRLMAIELNLLLHIVGAIMAWTLLQMQANKVDWKNSKAFKTLSSCSMPMYLFHQQIIYFTIIWLNGIVNPWINAGVNFLVALIGSFIISALLMRWKYTRFLIGMS